MSTLTADKLFSGRREIFSLKPPLHRPSSPEAAARMAAEATAQMLGEDGRGYELARRLEACGAWRAWLGDAEHAAFAHHLASPSSWEAFLSSSSSSSSSSSRHLLLLQLRARALLFDKASSALFLAGGAARGGGAVNYVNSSYLQLHADDIYFSLEDEWEDSSQHQMQSRAACSPIRESSIMSQRHKHDELPDTWYKQCTEKLKTRYQKFRSGDKEVSKRTPEGMSAYLKLCNVHKKKRRVFIDDQSVCVSATVLENGSSLHSKNAGDLVTEEIFIPEIIFPADCVPDSALPRASGISSNKKVDVHGALDNLPTPVSRSSAMLERFGMREYYKMGNKDRSRVEGKSLSEEQAFQITRKLVARFSANVGFESGTAVSMEVFSDVIIRHICKLGRNLKLLTDSYKKRFSSIELLKMFLQTSGYSNIVALMEISKVGNKAFTHQMHQDVHALQSQHQNSLLQVQQLQRQFHPQMNVVQSQNLAFQQHQHQLLQQHQQWERMRRSQMTSPRGSVMATDKNQPLLNVKIENTMDSQIDGPYGSISRQQQQLQLRQQQQQLAMAAMNQNAQPGQQFKQVPTMNPYSMRMPPVKVEAFQELVSGDSSLKHDNDPNKLTSPK